PSARGYDVGAAGHHPAASQPYCATLGSISVSYVLASRLRCRRPEVVTRAEFELQVQAGE
ncbi:unnamed protein product, partial [Pylaiella littoralis]